MFNEIYYFYKSFSYFPFSTCFLNRNRHRLKNINQTIPWFWFSSVFVVPDLETVKFKVLSRKDQYEIREVEVWMLLFLFLFFLRVPVIPFRAAFIQLIFMYLIFPIHLSASKRMANLLWHDHLLFDFLIFSFTRLYESK